VCSHAGGYRLIYAACFRAENRKEKMAKTNYFGALAAAVGALVAVALLVLILVLVNPQSAGAAFRGTNGKIAYQAWDGTDSEIYTINPNGMDKFQVTDNNVNDLQPSYSPDGNRITYSGAGGTLCANPADCTDDEIWTVPATGGTRVQVTCNITDDTYPSYSTSTPIRPLPVQGILYARQSQQVGGVIRIVMSAAAPCSAGGLNNQMTCGPFDDKAPAWTYRHDQIAYHSLDAQGDFEIFTIAAKTTGPGGACPSSLRATNNTSEDLYPDYRPDGRRFVYSGTGTSGTDAPGDLELYVVRRPFPGGTHPPFQLTFNNTDDLTPVYSPDEQRIAYSGRDQQAGQVDFEIYTISAGGGTPVKVTDNNVNDLHPSWQPIP
jgi:Tol biopolymer transport system component